MEIAMVAAKKKCFVISPIGEDGSETRQEADALLWVARSALEKYDFEVIRVDQIARAAIITTEIVQLIQESELCLIVLTGENPNVFYEAGRRHETGRPFIQLIRKGERIPFDVAGIRTIIYDNIQSLTSAARTVAEIQKFTEEYEKAGYGTSGTGVSMSTIAAAIDRIERKVGQLLVGAAPAGSGAAPPAFEEPGVFMNPREAFMTSIAQGQSQKAAQLLPRLEQLLGPSQELLAAAGWLSSQGYEPAVELVLRVMTESFDKIRSEGFDALKAGIGAAVRYYVTTDREAEGVIRCEGMIRKVASLPEADNALKAYVLNQLQMLHYGAEQYEDALKICEEVLRLRPDESAYVFNASLIYEKLGLSKKAIDMVDLYMSMDESDDPDASHLSHAIETYVEAGRRDDARAALVKLRQADPGKAAVLLMKSELRKVLL